MKGFAKYEVFINFDAKLGFYRINNFI
jgi:hypothetical protein